MSERIARPTWAWASATDHHPANGRPSGLTRSAPLGPSPNDLATTGAEGDHRDRRSVEVHLREQRIAGDKERQPLADQVEVQDVGSTQTCRTRPPRSTSSSVTTSRASPSGRPSARRCAPARPALGLVGLPQRRASPTAQDPAELPAEVEPVGDGDVEARAAARRDAVRGVADQEDVALARRVGELRSRGEAAGRSIRVSIPRTPRRRRRVVQLAARRIRPSARAPPTGKPNTSGRLAGWEQHAPPPGAGDRVELWRCSPRTSHRGARNSTLTPSTDVSGPDIAMPRRHARHFGRRRRRPRLAAMCARDHRVEQHDRRPPTARETSTTETRARPSRREHARWSSRTASRWSCATHAAAVGLTRRSARRSGTRRRWRPSAARASGRHLEQRHLDVVAAREDSFLEAPEPAATPWCAG